MAILSKEPEAMINSGADALFIDAATGHTSRVLSVAELSSNGNNVPVVAGNVVTSEGAKDLIEAGVSAVKVVLVLAQYVQRGLSQVLECQLQPSKAWLKYVGQTE